MTDSVQWLSQSDFNICVIIIVEYYYIILVEFFFEH